MQRSWFPRKQYPYATYPVPTWAIRVFKSPTTELVEWHLHHLRAPEHVVIELIGRVGTSHQGKRSIDSVSLVISSAVRPSEAQTLPELKALGLPSRVDCLIAHTLLHSGPALSTSANGLFSFIIPENGVERGWGAIRDYFGRRFRPSVGSFKFPILRCCASETLSINHGSRRGSIVLDDSHECFPRCFCLYHLEDCVPNRLLPILPPALCVPRSFLGIGDSSLDRKAEFGRDRIFDLSWALKQIWYASPHGTLAQKYQKRLIGCRLLGPVVRITPTLLLISDHSKLPEVYQRNVDKTGHYITGSFGENESLFNMRSHKTHAVFRKHIAGPVSFNTPKAICSNYADRNIV